MKVDKRINIKVTESFHKQIKIKATKEGKTITDVISKLLKEWIKN